ncbi:MAG: alpha/beta fold hydrolase [Gammaproteobacteria bacterium]|nr:alpha/beta fold hydrolase [Gammaproteobacteria bacterium]
MQLKQKSFVWRSLIMSGALAFSAAAYANSIAWGACPNASLADGYRCGFLTVPLSYKNPSQETTQVFVMQYTKVGAHPSKALYFNDGGPWGDQTKGMPQYIPFLDPNFTNQYTIFTFDPRGVGRSPHLSCDTDLNQDIFMDNPLVPNGIENLVAVSEKKWQVCASQYNGFQNHVGTIETVQDLDAVREAVGFSKMSFLAYSYGTQLGSLYLMDYPQHIDKMILDSVMPPTRSIITLSQDQAAAFEETLHHFFQQCDSNTHCPLYPNAEKAYDNALSILSKHTVPTGEKTDHLPLNTVEFLNAVEVALPFTDSSPESINPTMFVGNMWWVLASGIRDINVNNDGTQLQYLGGIIGGNYVKGRFTADHSEYNAVLCTDYDDHPDAAQIYQQAADLRRDYPLMGAFVGSEFLSACAGWTGRTSQTLPKLQYTADTPKIMLACNDHDSETPYVWCQQLAAVVPGSVIVHFKGSGHGIYLSNEPPGICVKDKVNYYLLQGGLPAPNTICDDTFNPTAAS